MFIKKFFFGLTLIIFGSIFFASNNLPVERYGLYIGCNDGGKSRERLLYAGSDASNFQKTMMEIGGVPKENSMLLLDPQKEDINKAFEDFSEKILEHKGVAKRIEFIFYYSGHSDENALLLGKNTYDYSSLKSAISDVPSDVHVVILDSCFSGNFIRAKGGKRQKAFLSDDSTVVQGHAYLSSSSESESSQESDEIRASFFTNAMLTGLRGAADSSGDNKVSLNELYYYAFNDTISKTQNSTIGPQHPSYNITLVGSGDLVLTDISEAEAIVSIPIDSYGRYIIRNENGILVSEINKIKGNAVSIALSSGKYTVSIITDENTYFGDFSLSQNSVFAVDIKNLRTINRTQNAIRGDAGSLGENSESIIESSDNKIASGDDSDSLNNNIEFNESKIGTNSSENEDGVNVFKLGLAGNVIFTPHKYSISIFSLNLITGNDDIVRGVQLSSILNFSNDIFGSQLAFIGNKAKNVSGAQISSIYNISSNLTGAQCSLIFNDSNNVHGVQISPIVNLASDVNGAQVSSLFNSARSVHGAQLGLVNIAKENTGISFGLINIIGNGVHDLSFSIDTFGNQCFQFQGGTKYLYTTLGVMSPFFDEGAIDYFQSVFGFGCRFYVKRFYFDTEILYKYVFCSAVRDLGKSIKDIYDKYDDYNDISEDDKTKIEDLTKDFSDYQIPALRFSINYSFSKHFAVFSSFNLDVCVSSWNDKAFDVIKCPAKIDVTDDVKLYPSASFGIKLK